jgi:hypothetical protein
MSATAAPSAAPPYAIPCWVDGHSLFFELRGVNGPYVVEFGRYDLSRALAILFTTFETDTHGEAYVRPANVAKSLMKEGVTQADHDAAAKALRQLGLIK